MPSIRGSNHMQNIKKILRADFEKIKKVPITSRCFGEPTTRLITEAVLTNELSEIETLNAPLHKKIKKFHL